ncbi:MAG: hypothetical protein PHX54_09380 [Lentimicrobiaceae bacterium]|nr:hypothetical protein [Lentimicrobiaceae bacterium]
MLVEQRVWHQIANGDKNVYALVYRDLFSRFFNHGRKFTSDTLLIEDAAQEALCYCGKAEANSTGLKTWKLIFIQFTAII